ncbi:MAG: S1 family peptidase [Polyangiaceae bacterium]|nr:S1 family peptidase [Polyangiaceae bacterium]
MRLSWLGLVGLGCVATLTGGGCGGSEAGGGPAVSQVAAPIQGGVNDTTDLNVVGLSIIMGQSGGMCTGSLIAPNLVLTARHCVSELENPPGFPEGAVACGQSTFGAVHPATSFSATTNAYINFNGKYKITDVLVPPESDAACGYDMALLILSKSVTETQPLIPRVDEAPKKGEVYRAVGYGATSDSQSGQNQAGTRRMRDSLTLTCASGCFQYGATDKEIVGQTGICQGDSGGPALDGQNRVFGVVSRGGNSCSSPIYGSVYKWANWIKDTALVAAEKGGYEPPAWAKGEPTSGMGGSSGAGGSPGTAGAAGTPGSAGSPGAAGTPGAGGSPGAAGSPGGGGAPGAGGEPASAAGAPQSSGPAFGTACKSDAECPGGVCVTEKGYSYCTADCAADEAICPTSSGYACTPVQGSDRKVCTDTNLEDASGSSGGCTVARGEPAKPVPWRSAALSGLALALAGLRRRRAR